MTVEGKRPKLQTNTQGKKKDQRIHESAAYEHTGPQGRLTPEPLNFPIISVNSQLNEPGPFS